MKGVIQLFLKNVQSIEDLKKKAYPVPSLIILIIAEILSVKMHLYREYTLWVLVINGVFFGYLVSRLIVRTMTHVSGS